MEIVMIGYLLNAFMFALSLIMLSSVRNESIKLRAMKEKFAKLIVLRRRR